MRRLLEVEIAVVEAFEEVGVAPRGVAEKVREAARRITFDEWREREKQRGHDIAALAELLGEKAGDEAARYVHLGLTSYDVVDTAWALVIRDALLIIVEKLAKFIAELSRLAEEYASLPEAGRTHGQYASPVTLGFKLANYVYELARRYEALCDTARRLLKAKIGGSVGTLAVWSLLWGVETALKIRDVAAKKLGLEPHIITTQVAPREGFAELACQLASLSGVLERFATEVRELSRPEIREWIEAPLGRVGSSAMPHKANPVVSERICGLARVARGFVVTALENIALWHERDLTNSSSERVWIPHLLMTIDQMLNDAIEVVTKRLVFNTDAIRNNLHKAWRLAKSEAILALLTSRGMARHEAHHKIMQASRLAEERGVDLIDVLLEDEEVAKLVNRKELEALKPERFVGAAEKLVAEALRYAKSVVEKGCDFMRPQALL